jgi:hypothetical protein
MRFLLRQIAVMNFYFYFFGLHLHHPIYLTLLHVPWELNILKQVVNSLIPKFSTLESYFFFNKKFILIQYYKVHSLYIYIINTQVGALSETNGPSAAWAKSRAHFNCDLSFLWDPKLTGFIPPVLPWEKLLLNCFINGSNICFIIKLFH